MVASIWVLELGSSCSKPGSATFWLYDLGQVTTFQSLSFHTVKLETVFTSHEVTEAKCMLYPRAQCLAHCRCLKSGPAYFF